MEQRSFFGDVIERAEWQRIQDLLATALRMEVRTFGPDGAELCAASGQSEYRRLLENSSSFREAVRMSRPLLIRSAGEQDEIKVVNTPTGRLRFSVPFFLSGQHIATIAGGGVVERPLPDHQVIAYAKQFGVDARLLVQAAKKLPLSSRQACLSAARLIAALLDQIITAVENRRKAEIRTLRLKVLAEVGHAVSDSLDLLRVLDTVASAIPQVMLVKSAVVALIEEDGSTLRINAASGLSDESWRTPFVVGTGLLGHVAATGEAVNVPDLLADPRNAYHAFDEHEGMRSMLAAPLRDGEQVVGVVAAFHGEPRGFTGGDEQVLESLADFAASAVRNARLFTRLNQAYRELGVSTRRLGEVQERLFHADRLATVGQMTTVTAHEMKNSLGGIIGAAATVRDQLHQLSDADVRELLAAIAEEGWRLRDTIETVRSYSKPTHFGTGVYEAAEVLQDVVRLLRFDKSFRDVKVELEVPTACAFRADRDRFKQVLLNLLRNAAEAFTGVTGRTPRIVLAARPVESEVAITVSDNGVGIPSELLTRIWEPFFTTKGEAGTGLGLDAVRQIVQGLGGSIAVDSEVGVGTTFTVRLPQASPPEATGEAAAAPSERQTAT